MTFGFRSFLAVWIGGAAPHFDISTLRTVTVPAESRTVVVPAESRVVIVPAEAS